MTMIMIVRAAAAAACTFLATFVLVRMAMITGSYATGAAILVLIGVTTVAAGFRVSR